MQKTLGVYVHIPFCRSKCSYCDFYSLAGNDELMPGYQEALLRHIREAAPLAADPVDSVYFGGGTPSYYGIDRLCKLLGSIKKYFSVSDDAEITVEANPDSADFDALKKLRRAGFNRLSLGVQSACNDQLADLGRIHTFEQAVAAVEAARKAKIKNISLDLIYGLPSQTPESWADTLKEVIGLSPQHISCYGLKVEEGTPLHARRESAGLPGDDAQADMYLYAVQELEKAGFRQYEISNFAKEGFESRHNLKYWSLKEYIGLGAAAHSDIGNRRYSYIRDISGYIDGVMGSGTIVAESDDLPQRERSGEYIMLRLRTAYGIDGNEYRNNYRMDFEPLEGLLKSYEANGWASHEENRWRLTPKGFLISNRLIGELLEAQTPLRGVVSPGRRY